MRGRLGYQDSRLSNVEHLVWQSLRAVVLLGLPQVERTFRRYGLVQLEFQLLAELYDAHDGMRLGELAAALRVSPSRLSHRIEKLSRNGLVKLQATEDDLRGTLAFATQAGRTLVDRLGAGHEDDLRRVLFAPLQPQQVRALADALSTVAAALTAEVEDDVELFGTAQHADVEAPARARRWRSPLLKEWPRR